MTHNFHIYNLYEKYSYFCFVQKMEGKCLLLDCVRP